MADTNLRQRKAQADEAENVPLSPPKIKITKADDDDDYSPWVDVLRVLTFLCLASCGLSYVISGGDSWFWGMKDKPDLLRADWWKEKINGPPPPTYLTPEELARYDGTDPEMPVYLAINGTIYDVSNGRHIYGPGGSYHFFAGVDAARGFVTGCFADDRTPDLRGVETMFLPLDDPETDAHWSAEELQALRAKELETAHEKANKALSHWVGFFANSKKYSKVGYVKREEGWLEKQPLKELCPQALKGRKKRQIPKKDDGKA